MLAPVVGVSMDPENAMIFFGEVLPINESSWKKYFDLLLLLTFYYFIFLILYMNTEQVHSSTRKITITQSFVGCESVYVD